MGKLLLSLKKYWRNYKTVLSSITLSFPLLWWITALAIVGILAYWILTPQPQAPVALDKLATVIKKQNNMQAYWAIPPGSITGEWPIPAEGGVIHRITDIQAQQESEIIQAVVPAAEVGIACGLMSSESVMDPKCVNGNWNGSNPSRSLWGADCGIGQLKLCDIEVDGKSGAAAFASPEDAQAFAFDVTKAVPYFWGLYQSHLQTADSWIAAGGPSNIDPRLMNRYVLAAVIYKRGAGMGTTAAPGARMIFEAGTWPAELNNFGNLVVWYSNALGIPSLV
jgi:hypothetical protein